MVKVISECWGLPSQILVLLVVNSIQLLYSTAKADTTPCGVKHLPQIALIHHGTPVLPGEWPWHVALFDREQKKTKQYICGGTIISKHFVLTAAHCLHTNPDRYFMKAGITELDNDSDPYMVIYNVFKIIKHPHYEPAHHKYSNDIALVRPEKVISFASSAIAPICLWPANDPSFDDLSKQPGIVIGFGLDETEKVSEILRKALVRVVQKQECLEKYSDRYPHLKEYDGKMCAKGDQQNVTVCSGDSGGGMHFAKNQVWYLRGIISTTAPFSNDTGYLIRCDPTVPAIYTDVSKYIPWINEHQRIVDQRYLLDVEDCGEASNSNVQDEMGKPMFNQYPWNVLIEIREHYYSKIYLVCNGVLIHPRYVLTVGHCVEGDFASYKLQSVRLGEYDIRSDEDRNQINPSTTIRYQSIDIEEVFTPYNDQNPIYTNNLALLKLKYNADTRKPNIKPICLPTVDEYKGPSLTLTGWKRNKVRFPKLERDAMSVSSTATCNREYEKLGVNLPASDNVMCAEYRERPKGHCYNYATGSALQYIKQVDEVPRYFLAGLTVFNFPYCNAHGSEMFVNPRAVSEWIKKMVK